MAMTRPPITDTDLFENSHHGPAGSPGVAGSARRGSTIRLEEALRRRLEGMAYAGPV